MPAVLKCHCHGIIFSWNTGNLLSAGKIPEKNIKQQFRIITGIIILHGILSRCQQYYIKGVLQTRRHLNLVFSDFMCRCVVCRSASVPLLYNILAMAQKPSVCQSAQTSDNCKLSCIQFIGQKFMKQTCYCHAINTWGT